MAKFRKKPVEIDAFHFKVQSVFMVAQLEKWLKSFGDEWGNHMLFNGDSLKVRTLEGTSYEVPADYWIIRGVAGEYYPCAPDIFDKTYENCGDT